MDFSSLQYFQVLYDCQSFSAAAEQIPMTVQGLRKAINQLEKELGVRLYISDKNTLYFTEAGKQLHEFGSNYISQYNALLNNLDSMRRGKRKEIKLSFAFGTFGVFTPRFTKQAERLMEEIPVSYTSQEDREIAELLKSGEYDFAVTWGSLDPEKFAYTHITDMPVYVLMNRKHPKAQRKSLKIEELQHEQLIFFDPDHNLSRQLIERCQPYGFRPIFAYSTQETMVMLTYVLCNLGISFVLPGEYSLYNQNQFQILKLEGVTMPIGISYLKHHFFTKEENQVIELLKETCIAK